MPSFNKVILVGNLTRDPELRYTPKGTAIARIGLAINRNWKTESGEAREEATFVDVDAFGKQAETIGQYLKKGRPLMVEGRLRLDQWDDKQTGQKRSKLGVVLEGFQFLDSGSSRGGGMPEVDSVDSSRGGESPSSATRPTSSPMAERESSAAPEDDDVPF